MKRIVYIILYLMVIFATSQLINLNYICKYYWPPEQWQEWCIIGVRGFVYGFLIYIGAKIYRKYVIKKEAKRETLFHIGIYEVTALFFIVNITCFIVQKHKNFHFFVERGYYLHADICRLVGATPNDMLLFTQHNTPRLDISDKVHFNQRINYVLQKYGVKHVLDLPISMRSGEVDLTAKLKAVPPSDTNSRSMCGVLDIHGELVTYSYYKVAQTACITLPAKQGCFSFSCYMAYNDVFFRDGWAQINLKDTNGDGYSDIVVEYVSCTKNNPEEIQRRDVYVYHPAGRYFTPVADARAIYTGMNFLHI